jgi:putative phosphoesterase
MGDRFAGLISDTHGLLRPEAVRALAGAEHIIHAGDVGGREVLEELRRIAPVTAVRGNTDRGAWADELPTTAVVGLGAHLVYVVHDVADLDLVPRACGFAAVVFGHSHRPAVATRDGVLYLNPGSAGPRRFDLPVTVMRLGLGNGGMRHEVVELLLEGR